MTDRGFIALARGFLDHPVVGAQKPFRQSEAWLWLLFEAAWKPRRYALAGAVVDLERGQLAHSTRYMARAWGWPETNVRRFLRRLETGAGTGAMIGATSGAGVTVITICNYEYYQTRQSESGAASGAPNGAGTGAEVAQERRRKEQGNKERKDITRSRAGEIEGFAEWYASYPRRLHRKTAAKAFAKVMSTGEISLAAVMAATRSHAAVWTARPAAELQFCPYPATWLNAGGYLDEPEPTSAASKEAHAPTRDPHTFTPAEWKERLATFEQAGQWPAKYWGPEPGLDGCLVPPELLNGIPATTTNGRDRGLSS